MLTPSPKPIPIRKDPTNTPINVYAILLTKKPNIMNIPPTKNNHSNLISPLSNTSCAIPPTNEEESPVTICIVQYNANVPLPTDGNVIDNGSKYSPAELNTPMAQKFSRNVDMRT